MLEKERVLPPALLPNSDGEEAGCVLKLKVEPPKRLTVAAGAAVPKGVVVVVAPKGDAGLAAVAPKAPNVLVPADKTRVGKLRM